MSDPSPKLRRQYIAALVTLALLAVASGLYLQRVISLQASDAMAINIAGRQRMLSQRIAKQSAVLASQLPARPATRERLDTSIAELESAHSRLFGPAGLVTLTGNLATRVAELDGRLSRLVEAARYLSRASDHSQNVQAMLDKILSEEQEFLPLMHEVVNLLEAEAGKHNKSITTAQWAFVTLILLTILLQSFFVFEPMCRILKSQLENAVEQARQKAETDLVHAHNAALQEELKLRHEVEAELQAVIAKFEKMALIASRTQHATIVTDAAGKIEYVNEAFERITGYTSDEAIGKRPSTLLQGELTDENTKRLIRDALARCEGIECELINYTKDKTPYWVELLIEPYHDEGSETTYFIGTTVDISERKVQAKQLSDAREMAEAANDAKTRFLTNMSHEIRTPLNGILGYSDLLLQKPVAEETQRSYLRTIHRSGQHLLHLVDDILDISAIENSRFITNVADCSPSQILEDVQSMLRVQAYEKGLHLRCCWDGPIPSTIRTDGRRFRQLLMNLVGNAIKFTDEGTVTVGVSFDSENDMLIVRVEDTGIGIEESRFDSIFERFGQADNSLTRQHGGGGLGLAICKQIVDELGGSIAVDSTPEIGSRFTVALPCGVLDGVQMIEEPTSAATSEFFCTGNSTAATNRLEQSRVLVCEDGETNRDLIGLLLSEAGADVTMAENGRIGVDFVVHEDRDFDVILMDMQMPVLDGYSATRELREAGWEKPIVALTAHAMAGDRQKCLSYGCSGYLTKPIEANALFETIERALEDTHQEPMPLIESREMPDITENDTKIRSSLPTDKPQFRAIVSKFVDKLGKQLEAMEQAVSEANFEELAEQAHWLKGAGGTMGFECFTSTADKLEVAARACDATASEQRLHEVTEQFRRLEVV